MSVPVEGTGEADDKSEGDASPSDSTRSFWLCKAEGCRHMNPIGRDACEKCFRGRWDEFKSGRYKLPPK